jgi:hypothetical protein
MTANQNKSNASTGFDSWALDAVIRIGLLALPVYWSLTIIGPFLTVALWSAIITVALYPLFSWMATQLGSRRFAAGTADAPVERPALPPLTLGGTPSAPLPRAAVLS